MSNLSGNPGYGPERLISACKIILSVVRQLAHDNSENAVLFSRALLVVLESLVDVRDGVSDWVDKQDKRFVIPKSRIKLTSRGDD